MARVDVELPLQISNLKGGDRQGRGLCLRGYLRPRAAIFGAGIEPPRAS